MVEILCIISTKIKCSVDLTKMSKFVDVVGFGFCSSTSCFLLPTFSLLFFSLLPLAMTSSLVLSFGVFCFSHIVFCFAVAYTQTTVLRAVAAMAWTAATASRCGPCTSAAIAPTSATRATTESGACAQSVPAATTTGSITSSGKRILPHSLLHKPLA